MPGLGSKCGCRAAAPVCPLVTILAGRGEGSGGRQICTGDTGSPPGMGTAPCSGAAARKSIIFYCSSLLRSGWNIPPKEKLVILPGGVPAEFLASAAINTLVHEKGAWARLPGLAGSGVHAEHTPTRCFPVKLIGELSRRLERCSPLSELKKQGKRGKMLQGNQAGRVLSLQGFRLGPSSWGRGEVGIKICILMSFTV